MASLVDPSGAGPDDDDRNFTTASREGDARRGEMVANAGHELKTPLSIILGLSGPLLAATESGSAERRDVERIRSNAYGLLKQVEDLLHAARIDDGRVGVEPVDCDVAALLRDTATGFQALLDERDQRLVLRTPGRLPARIDEDKLTTVVANLLANAVRFAPRGGVVRCTAAAGDGRLVVEVADSGPGVPAAEREAIFERFHQVSGARHRRPGGTGLGLAIVRELVTLLGGTVTAGEAPEGGALLRVTLPHEPAVAAPASGRRALGLNVAERERATLEALRLDLEALDRHDARRRTAADGLPRVLLVEPGPTLAIYRGAPRRGLRRPLRRDRGRGAADRGVDADRRRARRRRRPGRRGAARRGPRAAARRRPVRHPRRRPRAGAAARPRPRRRLRRQAVRRDAPRPPRLRRGPAAGRVRPRRGRRALPRGVRARADRHGSRRRRAGCSRSTPRSRGCSAYRATPRST